MKKFTLVELVVSIVVIAILLSIVLLMYNDFKKKSVYSSVSANISILQTAVDMYYLEYETYPTKNKATLSNPQIVNVEELVKKGMLKKDLNLSKINSQLYWVDVFGRVWGATEMQPSKTNVVEKKDKKVFEFTLEGEVQRYNIYEVLGYADIASLSYKDLSIEKPNDKVALASDNKYYRLVQSKEVEKGLPLSITYETRNKNSTYLVSVEDKYGLESAPFALEDNHYFKPIKQYEGEFEFAIEGNRLMYWREIYSLEVKPEGTRIEYSFKVKNEEGVYGEEWTHNFYELEPSKGVIVKIKMTGNKDTGEKPTLLDVRLFYDVKDKQKVTFTPNPPLIYSPESLKEIIDSEGEMNWPYYSRPDKEPNKGETNTGGSSTEEDDETEDSKDTGGNNTGGGEGAGNNEDEQNSGGEVINPPTNGNGEGETDRPELEKGKDEQIDITYDEEDEEKIKVIVEKPIDVCPAGYEVSGKNTISYLIIVREGESIFELKAPVVKNGKIVDTKIKHATLNSNNSYEEIDSIRLIPDSSCVNVIYTIEGSLTGGISIPPYVQKSEPVDVVKPTLEEWVTVDEILFAVHASHGKEVKWTKFEKSDYVPENTRITYTFSTIKAGNTLENMTNDLSSLPKSRNAVVIATLQVKSSYLGTQGQEEPKVNKMKLIHEGDVEISFVPDKPIVFINPTKDNNKDRMVYSVASNIIWDVWSFDPEGNEIINIEWAGDKRNKYDTAGVYTVKARVQNAKGIWSDWNEYTFDVYNEIPVASLNAKKAYIKAGQKIDWDKVGFDNSYDPDQDGIVERKWEGNVKSEYTTADLGEITLTLTVKDAEGNWSNKVTQTAFVYDNMLWINVGPPSFDNDNNTGELLSARGTKHNIYWIEDLTNRKVTMNVTADSTFQIKMYDQFGKQLHYFNNYYNRMDYEGYFYGIYNKNDISFIIPEGADYMEIYMFNRFQLNEISVNTTTYLPKPVTDLKVSATENSVKLQYKNEGQKTYIFRDNVFVGTTQSNEFVDKEVYGGRSYTYDLQTEDFFGNLSLKRTISTKTNEYDITFKNDREDSPKAFDYNLETSDNLGGFSSNLPPMKITWKAREGFNIPNSTEDLRLDITLKKGHGAGSGRVGIQVLDKDQKALKFYVLPQTDILYQTIQIENDGSLQTYRIILPAGADSISIKGLNRDDYYLDLFDVRFVGLDTVWEPFGEVKTVATQNGVKFTWNKPSSVQKVDIYNEQVYVGSSTGNSFEVNSLEPNTEYIYDLVLRNSDGTLKFLEPIKVKTLK